MNRYFALSCAFHLLLALIVLVAFSSSKKEEKATYTIDFIGTGKVVSMQQPKVQQPVETPKAEEVKKEVQKPAEKAPEAKKQTKKAYDSKAEISAKKQPKKKEEPKPAAPLETPSILDDEEKPADTPPSDSNDEEGEFEGGNIQTDFATFPYPWYITQVRNSLWSEWEKRRPIGSTLATMVSFAIARDGKIKDLKIVKSSEDDSFDFAARSSVINAGPFPPLPMLYEKDELTVTVEFKQEK
ncbi:MAG: TonB family protein [Elusimicrobiaceae bacterium]|nr:TonB family protein [Elusimicrobiaceae bacterium]